MYTKFLSRFMVPFSLLLLYSIGVVGQADRRLGLNIGMHLSAERDPGFSPLLFAGTGVFGSAAYSREGEARSDVVDMYYAHVSLNNRFGTGMGVQSAGIMVFHFYHRAKEPGKGLHWGWSSHNAFSVRNNESVNNFNNRFDYYTSFGPAARLRHPFTLFDRSFSIQAIVHVQLLGFVMQSSYVSNAPKGYEVETAGGLDVFRRSVDWFHPGRAWNIGIWPRLQYQLGSGNFLNLGYKYGFTGFDGAHRVTKSRGNWYFGIQAGL
jgi:hypothetical protein